MTRINTNVASLVAQNTLGRSNTALNQALTRLSTGLRINTGKDDPAGLIASENLRSDITSIKKAITNTDRANQVIATADSALGQVSGLLNDIRGLVTEAANTGALSDEQIAANQLQVDSSLEALNRVAQTTTFQGRRLLDGSLDFLTTAGSGFGTVTNLKIDQANLGATGTVNVAVDITAAATQAQITNTAGIPAAVTAVAASGAFTLSHTVAQATGTVTLTTTTTDATFTLAAVAGQGADGVEGNGVKNIVINDVNTGNTAVYDANTNTLTVDLDIAGGDNAVTDLIAAIDAGGDFDATILTNGANVIDGADTGAGTLAGGRDVGTGTFTVTSDTTGVNVATITLIEDGGTPTGTAVATLNGANIEVRVNGDVTDAEINTALDGLAGYSSVYSAGSGDQNYDTTLDAPAGPPVATLAGGVAGSGGLDSAIVIEVAGANGAEVLSFGQGSSINQVVAGINGVSDATGVTAVNNGGVLELTSDAYGSAALVSVNVLSGDTNDTFADGLSATRETGTDIVATVNGIAATGTGNSLYVNTATLDLTLAVEEGSSTDVNFSITGGGGLFQLGPDVVSNQQARIGITSVNTAKLGGVSGKVFQLGSGGTASLTEDTNTAAKIVEEAINQITSLRGRLGAFQRTTLETNKQAMNDTLVNLTEAESQIRDADFAEETAALTRAQILVQSGTVVLQISNQNPQNVLSLLGG
jgi:flagellin